MKKLVLAAFLGLPLVVVGCTTETVIKKIPAPAVPAEEAPAEEPEADPTEAEPAPVVPEKKKDPATVTPPSSAPEDTCLDGQDMDGADVNVATCPAIPQIPDDAPMGTKKIDLGAWEIGTTADGATYKYGTLSAPGASPSSPRTLSFSGGTTQVNKENLECWAKGYYRLRKILQTAPAEYVALNAAGFQYRFFQFQTDLRNGSTGYKALASFEDHLVKWVTVVNAQGVCQQPTLSKFKAYAKSELTRRGIALPKE